MHATQTLALIAISDMMRSILSRIDTIAASDSSVLLIGETGVGKELFAEYIHRTSPRSTRPFVKVGLSALPPELLESELFGHERGPTRVPQAKRRVCSSLPPRGASFSMTSTTSRSCCQGKLLRVLESREIMRVGGTAPIPIDVRLITATKVDLKEMVNRNAFRSDLYYRINVVPIVIPPLRERREDIPHLVKHFLDRYAADKPIVVTPDAEQALVEYAWPGNIRELRNVVQRMVLFANGSIGLENLPPEIREESPVGLIARACQRCFTEEGMSFDEVVACLETNLLRQALQQAEGNRSHAARALGMNLSTLRDKLKKYGLA